MIYILVLCALVTLCYGTKDIINFNPHEEECINELYGSKNHLLEQLFTRQLFIENNDVVRKVVSCSWEKEGIIDEEGEIVFDNFKKYLINSLRKINGCTDYLALLVAGDAFNYCKNISGSASSDTAIKISNCVIRKTNSYYLRSL